MAQNEDLDYNMGSSVIDDRGTVSDPDKVNMPLLRKHSQDLSAWITKHSSIDVIKTEGKLNADQQIAVHKEVVKYLRMLKNETDAKIEELTNG